MDITATTGATRAPSIPRGLIPAGSVLAAALLSLVGTSWDLQWHTDVGPDTFFTLSHLFMYAGSAAAGLTSLVVVLRTTAQRRSGAGIDPIVGGRPVGVLGRTFSAPVSYLVTGCGAASFLLYGLWDQWWHSLYGFDAEISSPPHVGLLVSISVTMVGATMVFATAREHRWGRIGMMIAAATLLSFSVITAYALDGVVLGTVNAYLVANTFLCVVVVMTTAFTLRRPGGAVGTAAFVTLSQVILWHLAPWAAEWYAGVEGLPMRDYLDPSPMHPSMLPMILLAPAVLVELLRTRTPAWITGLAAGVVLGAWAPIQAARLNAEPGPGLATIAGTALACAAIGALAGYLALRFGDILWHLAPTAKRGARPGSANADPAPTTVETNNA